MAKRKRRYILALVILAALCVFASIVYVAFTASGAKKLATFFLSRYSKSRQAGIARCSGSLLSGLTLNNLYIKDIEGVSAASELRVQEAKVSLTSLTPAGVNVEIFNGRLDIPASGQILFSGSLHDAALDFNVYSNKVSVDGMRGILEGKGLPLISGTLTELDFYVKGTIEEPLLKGGLTIGSLSYDAFTLTGCPVFVELSAKNTGTRQMKLFGSVRFNDGKLTGPKTAAIDFEESAILFSGQPDQPKLDIRGVSKVEGTVIHIVLTGTTDSPSIQLTSESALSSERLMVMLLTGKSWGGVETSLTQGKISPDIAKDFIDYFFFGGSGSQLAERFGLEISVHFDQDARGLEVGKKVTDKAKAVYEVEQAQNLSQTTNTTVTHKVGAEVEVSDGVSIGAKREIQGQTEEQAEGQDPEQEIYLKFKKKF